MKRGDHFSDSANNSGTVVKAVIFTAYKHNTDSYNIELPLFVMVVCNVSEAILAERVRELESHPSATAMEGGVSEIKRVRKERDELKEAVRNFETELTQIQMDTKMLAEDRDNFKLLYEQVS